MTHKQLVKRIANWLKWTHQNTVVMAELVTAAGETPDVIAWKGAAFSTLVEVKASRSDFMADRIKWFRRDEERGMGNHRYFATPKGLLKPEEIPDGWGLLEVEEHCIREKVEPIHKEANKQNECKMLMSAIRRLEISTAVFVMSEEQESKLTEKG
jgi:hypothetical protein